MLHLFPNVSRKEEGERPVGGCLSWWCSGNRWMGPLQSSRTRRYCVRTGTETTPRFGSRHSGADEVSRPAQVSAGTFCGAEPASLPEKWIWPWPQCSKVAYNKMLASGVLASRPAGQNTSCPSIPRVHGPAGIPRVCVWMAKQCRVEPVKLLANED